MCERVKVREGFDVFVGRPTEFGNPWKAGVHGTLAEVLERYRGYIENRIAHDARFRHRVLALKGKRIACPCSSSSCHASILAEIVNRIASERPV